MALQTKTFQGSTSDSSKWTWKIEAIEESADISTKKSKITVKSYIGRPSNQTDSHFQGSANLKFVVGDQTYTEKYTANSKVYVDAGKWVLVGSHTFDDINNTGTDTSPTKITVSGSMSTSDFNPNTASATGIMTLTVLHIAPVLNISSVAENNSNLTGVSGTTFITNLSKKIFTVGYTLYDSATASSLKIYDKNGNELKSTSSIGTISGTITVDFSSITLPDNTITNNKTTFIIKIIDSLSGETSITTPEYTVIPYQLPNLVVTSSNIKRNGQLSGKGLLNLIGTFYNATIGSKTNTITLSFAYWKVGSTESTTYYTIPSSTNTGSENNIKISNWNIAKNETEITDLDKSYAYKFKIKAVDTFGNSSTIELICNKGEYIMCEFQDRVDFKKITIGNVDIIETGSNDNGDWIKFADGTMICTQIVELRDISVSTAWGNIYAYIEESDNWHEFPQVFTKINHFSLDIGNMVAYNGFWLGDYGRKLIELNRWQGLCILRPTSATISADIYVLAIGKWK